MFTWPIAGPATVRNSSSEHRQEITIHQAAKEAFNKMDGRKLPKVKEWSEELAGSFLKRKSSTRNIIYNRVLDVEQFLT